MEHSEPGRIAGILGRWWQLQRRHLLRLWAIGVVASIVTTLISATGQYEPSQAKGLDFLMRLRGQQLVSEVVVVAIDDAAFERLGQRQPLPRDYLATLLRALKRSGAAVVGMDIAFTAASSPEADAALARAVAEFNEGGPSRVVVVSAGAPTSGPLADRAFLATVLRGAPDVAQDQDGVVRRATLLVPREGEGPEPALGLVVAARLQGRSLEEVVRSLPFREPGGLFWINYAGPAGTFLTIPGDVVATLAEVPPPPDNPFRGKAVLIGATFQESRDLFQTPHGLVPGVEIHANIVHMILTDRFIRPTGWPVTLALQIAVVMVASVAMVSVKGFLGGLAVLAVVAVVSVPASYAAFQRGGYWVDFVLPALATKMAGSWADKLARKRFNAAFGRYVGADVAAQILAEHPSLGGERREVTVLFSDLRGFTTISETLAPEKVATHLNEYFDAMTAAIFRHRGMVNDFIGDAVMAIFGAPLPDPDHALHAVQSATAMEAALAELNARWADQGLPQLRMGIGVHTGQVFAGNVGGRSRIKYTIVGDAVNVASRVEGLNKEQGTTILITEATRALLDGRVDVRDCGALAVKGRTEPVRVYELLAVHAPGAAGSRGALEEARA